VFLTHLFVALVQAAAADVQRSLERDQAKLQTLRANIATVQSASVRNQAEAGSSAQHLEQIKGELEAAQHRLRTANAAVAARQKELSDLGVIIDGRVRERDDALVEGVEKHRQCQAAEAKLRNLQSRSEILEKRVAEQARTNGVTVGSLETSTVPNCCVVQCSFSYVIALVRPN